MIVLDDFKTALDRLQQYQLDRMGSVLSDGVRGDFADVEQARRKKAEQVQKRQIAHAARPHDSVVSESWNKPQGAECIDFASALRMDMFEEEEERIEAVHMRPTNAG